MFLWCPNSNCKFSLLIDLWPRTQDRWRCENLSTRMSLEHGDEATIEFLTFALQKPISGKILSNREWVMCLVYHRAAGLAVLDCRGYCPWRLQGSLNLRTAEERGPRQTRPFRSPGTARLQSSTGQQRCFGVSVCIAPSHAHWVTNNRF